MHYAVWNVRAYARRFGLNAFHQDLAVLELVISLASRIGIQVIDIKERPART